jgi:hypothetical protein
VVSTVAIDSSGQDLASFRKIAAQPSHIFVINGLHFIYTERTNLLATALSLVSLVVHGVKPSF